MESCIKCGAALTKAEVAGRVCYPCEIKLSSSELEKLKALSSSELESLKAERLNEAIVNDNKKEKLKFLEQEERNRCLLEEARKSGDWSNVPEELITEKSKTIILTTSYTLASLEVNNEIDIITAEIAYGMNVFRDIFAGVRDIVGGNSKAVQKILRDSRNAVLAELRKEAFIIGADAVIAVNLNYQEFSGGGKCRNDNARSIRHSC